MLVDYWDSDTEAFQNDGIPLRLEVEDIYFITGLSCRGEIVNLRARGVGGGLTIDEYIVVYFLLDTKTDGIQVPVNDIRNLSLKFIVLVLGMIAGLTSLHQDSRALMFYTVECMRPTIYDWITSLLGSMRQQLAYYKLGRTQNFGYANILSTFFFERVPSLSPRV